MYYVCIFYVYFRRRVEFDLVESPLLELSDDYLLELVRQLQQDNPDVYESMVVESVRSRGFRVSRPRIRNASQLVIHFEYSSSMAWYDYQETCVLCCRT